MEGRREWFPEYVSGIVLETGRISTMDKEGFAFYLATSSIFVVEEEG